MRLLGGVSERYAQAGGLRRYPGQDQWDADGGDCVMAEVIWALLMAWMLTQTLRSLQRDGLVERIVYPTTPPMVDYRLTGLGRSVLEPLAGLIVWADKRHDDIRSAREAFDR